MSPGKIARGSSFEAVRRAEVELIRDAVRRAVQRDSLRSVARELEMSPSGLRGFIDGANSYGKTKEKLRVWYALHLGDSGSELSPETAAGLVETLLREIPDSRRAAARDRVLGAFAGAFEAAEVAPPAWTGVPRRKTAPVS